MMVEEWKRIPGFGDRYEVSNLGRVRSVPSEWKVSKIRRDKIVHDELWFRKGKVLKPVHEGGERPVVRLYRNDGTRQSFSIDKLVAMVFLNFHGHGARILHKNGDLTDCRLSNLEVK